MNLENSSQNSTIKIGILLNWPHFACQKYGINSPSKGKKKGANAPPFNLRRIRLKISDKSDPVLHSHLREKINIPRFDLHSDSYPAQHSELDSTDALELRSQSRPLPS